MEATAGALPSMEPLVAALPPIEGAQPAAGETPGAAQAAPASLPVEHLIVIDFEGTCDPSDEALTRLQQCDIHEIIEFPAVWMSARGADAGTEIDFFREYVKPVEGAAEGKAREISPFCARRQGRRLPHSRTRTAIP